MMGAIVPLGNSTTEGALEPGGGSSALSLVRTDAIGPVLAGQSVVIEVRMSNVGDGGAAGFQAFLEYDPTMLSFVSGAYPASPFGLAVIDPIAPAGSDIDLAAGIDVFNGQGPTFSDGAVAELTFTALAPSCVPAVRFRFHQPPTRLTTGEGGAVLPLRLVNPVADCPCDWNCDGVLNSQDFFDYLNDFFAQNGDFNRDGMNNSQDFFDFLNCFFRPGLPCNP